MLQGGQLRPLKAAMNIVLASTVLGLVFMWAIAVYFLKFAPVRQKEAVFTPNIATTQSCARLDNEVTQGECYISAAKAMEDEKICENVRVSEIKALCYVDLAELKNNSGLCQNEAVTGALASSCNNYFSQTESN